MTNTLRMIQLGVLAGALTVATVGHADVTGSYDGTLTAKKAAPVAAAATFTQSGKLVSGTVALPLDLATFGGAYLMHGTATPKRIKLSGSGPNLVKLTWGGKIVGDTLVGKAKVKGSGKNKLTGALSFARNVSTADGSACDAVYNANTALFTDQVVATSLTSCTACHAPGLQAGATRFHVNAADPLATARALALMVDTANPSASRILAKPLGTVPHGGGVQLVAGTPAEQTLSQWVALVAAANCN